MRLELSGNIHHPNPIGITFTSSNAFDPTKYLAMGYTNFDVIAIGGGGGMGGGIDTANTGTLIRSYGGAGGGGGIQRVKGLLSALPAAVPIVVGQGGAPGVEDPANVGLTTDGGDGGYSSFNGNTCEASGGKGGKRVQSNSHTVTTQANGGDGGVGGSQIAGGGGKGGTAGTPAAGGPGVAGTSGADGTWNGSVGSGGGGGAGGVGTYGARATENPATAGGRGAYNPGDTSVSVLGGLPSLDQETGASSIMPGFGGGAKATPVNGLPYAYGSSEPTHKAGDAGVVVIKLTAV